MDKNKIIDKLLKKYPDLQEEPLFDELLSMDAEEESNEEMDDMGEAPDVEVEIEAGSEEAPEGEEDMSSEEDKAIEDAMADDSEEETPMPDKKAHLREMLMSRKKMKKA